MKARARLHRHRGGPNLPRHGECLIISLDGGHRLLFIEVADGTSVKNRIHPRSRAGAGSREDELAGTERVTPVAAIHGDADTWLIATSQAVHADVGPFRSDEQKTTLVIPVIELSSR
ncbi:MAG: hypothetical protein ABIU87_06155 [Ornithinibacter sp.]